MNPYEHPTDTKIISGNYQNWINQIEHHYLNRLTVNDSVLEIASGPADISKVINQKVKDLTMLDSDVNSDRITGVEFINQDAFFWLPTAPQFDVVVCFGLIYHIHDGLRLLEMIVNYCKPKKIILDSVVAPHPLAFTYEELNTPGNRNIPKNWKCAPFNMNVPFHIFNQSLDFMGYTLNETHLIKCDFFSKSNSWVAEWEIKLK